MTLRRPAESLSLTGAPVFLADMKGNPARKIGMALRYQSVPAVFRSDLRGESSHPVRSIPVKLEPPLLPRLPGWTAVRAGVLNIAFRLADKGGLPLTGLKDLHAMLTWLGRNALDLPLWHENISGFSTGAFQRAQARGCNGAATVSPRPSARALPAAWHQGRALVRAILRSLRRVAEGSGARGQQGRGRSLDRGFHLGQNCDHQQHVALQRIIRRSLEAHVVQHGLFGAQTRQTGAGPGAILQTQKSRQITFAPPVALPFAGGADQQARATQRGLGAAGRKGNDIVRAVQGCGHGVILADVTGSASHNQNECCQILDRSARPRKVSLGFVRECCFYVQKRSVNQNGKMQPRVVTAGPLEDDKGSDMTIVTGDFAPGASAAEHREAKQAAPGCSSVPGDEMALDAQLYLRHVENGETIRALAREAGCHASTILRRIRRFEARRDDPLVDGALARSADALSFDDKQALRILRRLSEPGAIMVSAAGMDKAIVTRDDIRTAVLERALAEEMALRGWVVQSRQGGGRLSRYVLAPAGRDALRRMLRSPRQRDAVPGPGAFCDASPVARAPDDRAMAEAAAPFDHADRHRIWEDRTIRDPEDDRRRRVRVNIAESPLLLLARRRDANGQAFLTQGMVAAGERLREDFELAQMGPRVTQNWDGFMTAGIDISRQGGGQRGGSESARDRVALALRELGPGMGDIVLRVCCFLEGIEMTERRLGWSARSGKIVLRLALMRLERHYAETYGKGAPLIG